LPARFAAGEIVDAHGRAWAATDPVAPGEELWFHRELRPEAVPAAELTILHRDEHLLVIDKPHEIATMPRGAHVLASALVRLRRATGIDPRAAAPAGPPHRRGARLRDTARGAPRLSAAVRPAGGRQVVRGPRGAGAVLVAAAAPGGAADPAGPPGQA